MPAAGFAAEKDSGWPSYAGHLTSDRFSDLTQITAENAGDLRELCEAELGDEGSFQPGLVVIGDTLYATTAHTVVALNAANCSVRWRYRYRAQGDEVMPANRGVAYLDGKLFRGTADGWILSLDAATGREIWKVKAADPAVGEFFSAASLAWNGFVFIGPSGGDWGIQGHVMAFDAATGKEIWRFNTIPLPGEAGYETWRVPQSAQRGGGGTWTSYTLDQETGELFVPVANPSPNFRPDLRPGENLYTDSFVVLDARSGKLKWYYQFNRNDGYDYDLAAAPTLFTDKSGHRRIAVGSKNGNLYIFDRDSHQLLSKTAVTTITTPTKPPPPEGVHACPGSNGGVEWNGPAYSPITDAVYVGSVDMCQTFHAGGADYVPSVVFLGTGVKSELTDKQSGWIYAINVNTGNPIWRYHTIAPVLSGVTATAGGVVFSGDSAGNFLVFDANSGQLLKRNNLGGSMGGGISTYSVNGRQFVATTAGNLPRTGMGKITDSRPRVIVMTTQLGADYKLIHVSAVPASESDAAVVADQGRARYRMTCAVCHGTTGKGGPNAPPLVSDGQRLGFQQIVAAILKPKSPMPKLYPIPLTRSEVDAIAQYVGQLK